MSTQRIVFAVLGASLYLSAVTFGDESTEDYATVATSSPELIESIYGESVDVFPDRTVTIYSGNSMRLRMLNQYENLTSCIVTLPSGELFDTINDKSEDMSSFDQCGVLVNAVSDNHTGTWRLDATIGEDVKYYGTFLVEVLDLESIPSETTSLHVQRGTSVPITIGPSSATSCRFWNSLGQKLPLRMGNCQTNIESVNEADEGVWTARYSLAGGVNLIEEKFEIFIYDESPSLNATVTISNDGQIHLLCRVRAVSASLCQFIAPSGDILDIVNGVGKDRYSQYGRGLKSDGTNTSQVHECGLTISNPIGWDYEDWKCIVATDSGLTGSILKIPKRYSDDYIYVSSPNYEVHAIKGNSFEVKCNANAILRHCWMRSPTGKVYTVSMNGNSPTALQYTGMGLSLGECGAIIPASEYADEGDWQCRVGLVNGDERGTEISVTVTDTVLVPTPRTVTPNRRHAQLSCYTPHQFGYSIDYCLWIGPNGDPIQDSRNPRYNLHKTRSSCSMTIRRTEESLDIGKWTCIAGLVGFSETVSTTIEVLATVTDDPPTGTQNTGHTFYFFMLVGFAISATCLAAMLLAVLRAKLMSRRNKLAPPPSYNDSNINLPHPVLSHMRQ